MGDGADGAAVHGREQLPGDDAVAAAEPPRALFEAVLRVPSAVFDARGEQAESCGSVDGTFDRRRFFLSSRALLLTVYRTALSRTRADAKSSFRCCRNVVRLSKGIRGREIHADN